MSPFFFWQFLFSIARFKKCRNLGKIAIGNANPGSNIALLQIIHLISHSLFAIVIQWILLSVIQICVLPCNLPCYPTHHFNLQENHVHVHIYGKKRHHDIKAEGKCKHFKNKYFQLKKIKKKYDIMAFTLDESFCSRRFVPLEVILDLTTSGVNKTRYCF